MIRTDIDIKDAITELVSDSELVTTISGKVYKDQRPLNSDKEDIVIAVLSRDAGKQLQEALVNVNIYVPDIRRDGDMIEDTSRLRTLCTMAAEVFDYCHNGDSIFEIESQQVYKVNGIDWHAINNRIRVRFNNEQV